MSFNSNAAEIAVIIQTPPTADLEASELLLALAAFDVPVVVLFCGLGIHWLHPQEPRKPQGKAAHKVLSALPLYGVEEVFYLASEVEKYSSLLPSLPDFATALTAEAWQQKLQHCAHAITF